MSIHDTRNWAAKETTNFAGGDRKITVTGDVEVGAGNEEPVLTKASPQGVIASTLLLDLSTKTTGDFGTDALVWKPVSYSEPVDDGQYTKVEVRGHATFDVERIIS